MVSIVSFEQAKQTENPSSNQSSAALKVFWCLLLLVLSATILLVGKSLAFTIDHRGRAYDIGVLAALLPEHFSSEDPSLSFLVMNTGSEEYRNVELLGLRQSRLAYQVQAPGLATVTILPVTAEDGFNGSIDLLVAVNDFGRIAAVAVVDDIEISVHSRLHGQLQGVESQWIKRFATKTMREVKQLSWQKIPAHREYDQFVGASITPNLVASRIYDSLVFYQSNRIALSVAFL